MRILAHHVLDVAAVMACVTVHGRDVDACQVQIITHGWESVHSTLGGEQSLAVCVMLHPQGAHDLARPGCA